MRYNAEAVESAIRNSRQPIGRREARLIHALLKGHEKKPVDTDKVGA